MFDPGPCVYMEKMAGGRRHRRPAGPRPPAGGDARAHRRAQAVEIRDVMVVVLDRPRHETAIARDPRAGARVRLITDGDVSAALLAVVRPLARRPAVGRRRHAGGRHLRGGDQVHRRPAGRPAVAARRRGAPGGARRRLRPRPRAHQDDLVARRRLLLLGHRRDRRRRPSGRALPAPRRHDRVARDALALGDRAPRARHAQPREAARDHRRALRLTTPARSRSRLALGPGTSSGCAGKRPTRDSARSRRASERRKPCVTITWMRDCVFVEPAADRERSPGRSSRPRPRRGARAVGVVASQRRTSISR